MTRRSLASCGAAALLSLLAWQLMPASEMRMLHADPVSPTLDTDGDFLPDVVEWACLTNPQNPDTDSDGVSDFVEVVQRGNPRRVGLPRPSDHEMRVVVTANEVAGGVVATNIHLLFRFMGDPSLLGAFRPWLRIGAIPGLEISLDSLASGVSSILHHVDPVEGYWVRVLVPLASENALRMLLPCTIGARAAIGGRQIDTAVALFDARGTTSTLVPFADDSYAVQSIGSVAAFQGGGSNRICVLQLTEVGTGPGGVAYEVSAADCDDCNGLQCGVDCPHAIGWIFVVPGGVEVITGG